jgi:haloalkane dehalogenase
MTTDGPASPGTTPPENSYVTHRTPVPGGDLHVIDHPGDEPAIVLLHGFPDDWRIYQRLLPHLAPRRAVAFDFLGYGHSARPARPNPGQHEAELTAVLDTLGIERAVLAGHDAGGPVAVNVTVASPGRVARLVLMNTYYGTAPQLRFPEMIRLFADPAFVPLADAMTSDPDQRMWLLAHTARQFGLDPLTPDGVGLTSVIPQFFGETGAPDALPAIRAWTAALFPALVGQDATIEAGRLAALEVPVSLIYGARDPYLSPALARHLATLFSHADLHLIDAASHWPQADQPETVARLLKETVAAGADANSRLNGARGQD